MVKHILTTKCPRKCSYCISKNIKIEQANYNLMGSNLYYLYKELSSKHNSIMLTGGEPTQASYFDIYVVLARRYFKQVFITTQDESLLSWKDSKRHFDAITFSFHDLKVGKYAVTNGSTVYASIMSHLYSDWLVINLKKLGYAGLTINENHFGTEIFNESQLPQIDGFSIKINRHHKCFKKDTVYIMPDLSIKTSFEEYL